MGSTLRYSVGARIPTTVYLEVTPPFPRHLHFLWTLRMNLRIRRCYETQNTSEGGAYTRNPSPMLTRYPVDGSVPHFMVLKVSVSRRPFRNRVLMYLCRRLCHSGKPPLARPYSCTEV